MSILEDRLKQLDEIELHSGGHESFTDGHCAMEVAAWLAGEEHSDSPDCASPVIGAFVRNWNDALPDSASRNRLIRPILAQVVGSRGSVADEEKRAWIATDWLVRQCTPAFLDLSKALRHHAEALRALPEIGPDTVEGARAVINEARKASAAAWDAAWDAASASAWDAARAAASASASASAWDAARAAARAAACAAARDAARDAAWDAAWAKLQPVVDELQPRAVDLLRRMLEVK